VVQEKQKLASALSRYDALAMELQGRLDEKEARGEVCLDDSYPDAASHGVVAVLPPCRPCM
jgi:cytochrome c peroxidase